jgi:hypothetical protein
MTWISALWYVPASRIIHLAGQTTGVTNGKRKRQPTYVFEARRRYFLKNHGSIYAAMADAGRIIGLVLWRIRVILTGKKDSTPAQFLWDSIRHSVFLTGFELREVSNPALAHNDRESGTYPMRLIK